MVTTLNAFIFVVVVWSFFWAPVLDIPFMNNSKRDKKDLYFLKMVVKVTLRWYQSTMHMMDYFHKGLFSRRHLFTAMVE